LYVGELVNILSKDFHLCSYPIKDYLPTLTIPLKSIGTTMVCTLPSLMPLAISILA